MRLNLIFGALVAGALSISGQAFATPVVTFGAGTAVTTVDRSATFDALTDGTSLAAYTEDGLSITAPGVQGGQLFVVPPGPVFYSDGGTNGPIAIATTDNTKITGLEMNVGSGYGPDPGSPVAYAYVVMNNGVVDGSGTFSADYDSVVGFSDALGFDEVLFGAYRPAGAATTALTDNLASDYEAGFVDNVKAQLLGDTAPQTGVPAPGALALLGFGLAGFLAQRRRKVA